MVFLVDKLGNDHKPIGKYLILITDNDLSFNDLLQELIFQSYYKVV